MATKKKIGVQAITKGDDCGAHEALRATDSPKSVKAMLGRGVPYKHR